MKIVKDLSKIIVYGLVEDQQDVINSRYGKNMMFLLRNAFPMCWRFPHY